jgi:3-(3-hydroxy-phenyl)propionate hydroxylase
MAILDSYDTKRRPHAKSIIDLALLMGGLIMPRNRLAAFGIHGLMALLQQIPGARSYFADLKIKPQNRFRSGLFRLGGRRAKLVRGGLFPQAWCAAGRNGPASRPVTRKDIRPLSIGRARWC